MPAKATMKGPPGAGAVVAALGPGADHGRVHEHFRHGVAGDVVLGAGGRLPHDVALGAVPVVVQDGAAVAAV